MKEKIELKVCANKDQVEHAEEILAALGLSISEAISMFLAQIVLHDGLPFEVVLPDMDSRDVTDRAYDIMYGGADSTESVDILAALGLSVSEAVSIFLAQVLLRGGLPFKVGLPEVNEQEVMDQVYELLHGGPDDMTPTEDQLSLDDDSEVPWNREGDQEEDYCAV